MKLLVCTQAVDRNDPILGFFHRWIEVFAEHCEQVTVICLREGDHALPANVRVLSLGKDSGASRGTYLRRFFSYVVRERATYDAVFVHMNQIYVVLGGPLWRLWGKRIGLWYTHKSVSVLLRIATYFAHTIFTASKESFRLRSKKIMVMGHGIDTDFWTPDKTVMRESHWLSVGRLNKTKRHDKAIRAAVAAHVPLHIAGEGPEHAGLEHLAHELGADVTFLGPLSKEALRDEYRRAIALIHTSETGSLDKVVLEARLCGCPLKTEDPALKYLEAASIDDIRNEHSLAALVPRILKTLS